MDELTLAARALMKAWSLGLVQDCQVEDWADARILASNTPGALPDWLYSLSSPGPRKCSQMSSREFDLEWSEATFSEEFAVAVYRLDLLNEEAVATFVEWLSRACMGDDLERPEVKLGYYADHLWGDCDRMDLAIDLIRRELPAFLPACRATVEALLAEAGR